VTACCAYVHTENVLTAGPAAAVICSLCDSPSVVAHIFQVLPLWAVLLVMVPIFVAGVRFIVVNRTLLPPCCLQFAYALRLTGISPVHIHHSSDGLRQPRQS